MKFQKISFIVPLFNHLDESRQMLSSLLDTLPHTLNYEIILVDDFSTDETRNWLRTLNDSRIRIILNSANLGYAKANNIGAKAADGSILCLVNNDVVFESGWLEPMLAILETADLNAGLVGNIQYRVANGEIDHAGIELNARAQFTHIQDLGIIQSSGPLEVIAVTGACVLIWSSDFDRVGGFDEAYINGCEDLDLCFKLRAMGKKIYLTPESSIKHHVSLSRDRSSAQNQRNSQILFGKWRHEIIEILTDQWVELIEAGPITYNQFIDGDLTSEFLSDRKAAASLIAQSMLLKEEYHWIRNLNQDNPNDYLEDQFEVSGLVPVPSMNAYLAEHEFELTVSDLYSIANFFVCGRKINAQVSGPMAITITIDDNQTKTFILPRGEAAINLGIVNPILSGAGSARFKVRVDYVDEEGHYLQAAGKTTLVTHFVVDGQMIAALHET